MNASYGELRIMFSCSNCGEKLEFDRCCEFTVAHCKRCGKRKILIVDGKIKEHIEQIKLPEVE